MGIFRSRWKKCPTCDGTGKVKDEGENEIKCPDCKGRGKIISPSMM